MEKTPFILGSPPQLRTPLSRFLPPLPEGVALKWLTQPGFNLQNNKWILDPFGVSPGLVIEAAQSGFKVMVAANNPISRFLIEMTAAPPEQSDFLTGLAELASSQRGEDRLENHIRQIYQINCLECGREVEVDTFLWEKSAAIPYGVIYTCQECGADGERLLPSLYAEKAEEFARSGLHQARALERVASRDDPDRIFVEEALTVYSPRAIYVLFTLINKIDSLHINQDQKRALQALLLCACDQGNAMWGYPSQRDRPKQLSTPSRYRENNIWKIIEDSGSYWADIKDHVPFTIWPELPESDSGICIYEGPFRNLVQEVNEKSQLKFQAVLGALPRPNQAFWTLSALWSGWLWGREAVGPFKSVLRRRRYDWNWLYAALKSVFENMTQHLDPGIKLLGITSEAEAGLLTATMNAAFDSGLEITGLACRDKDTQFHWTISSKGLSNQSLRAENAVTAMNEFLSGFGQPAPFLKIWSAGLTGLFAEVRNVKKDLTGEETSAQGFSETNAMLRDILTYRGGYLRFGSSEALETSLWWKKDEGTTSSQVGLSTIDQVEMAVVQILTRKAEVKRIEIEEDIFQQFTGLFTPDSEWLQVILDSYADEKDDLSDKWTLRKEDQPSSRREDLVTMQGQLQILADRYGYTQSGDRPLVWSKDGIDHLYIYRAASAVLSNLILHNEFEHTSPPHKSLVVLPGGRANLVVYKLRMDPRLQRLCSPDEQTGLPGWRFLKMRHLRWLVDNANNLQAFENQLPLDPLTFTTPQMRFA